MEDEVKAKEDAAAGRKDVGSSVTQKQRQAGLASNERVARVEDCLSAA